MKDIIQKYQFKDGLPLEFEIVDINGIFETKKKMLTIPHRAQFYHILWIEKGKGTHMIDFKPIPIENNSIIFIPVNSVNVFDAEGIYNGKAIIFTDHFFCKNEQDLKFLHSSILFSDLYKIATMKFNPNISNLKIFLNAMETEFKRKPDAAQFHILHNMLHIFLLQAERELRTQGFEELKPSIHLDYLLLFKELLEKNYKSEKSVNKYATELGISDKQLHKSTTTLLEKTPKQIIDERIVLESKRLLVHSSLSIKEIAYDLGYDEPTNFIKYFKKHIHSTPSEFRDQY